MSVQRLSVPLALLLLAAACGPRTERVAMRDGVRLATTIHQPSGDEVPRPTILVRTPYSRALMLRALFTTELNAGANVVVQDMRGRFGSDGVDQLFTTDADDGYDTMEWLVDQPWSDGTIVTSGASALGIVQYMAAPTRPPGLLGVMPTVATPTVYDHILFHDGVLRDSLVTGFLEVQGSEHFLDEIAAHPYDDGRWDSAQTTDRFGEVDVAGLHVGGWYDIFLQGTLDAFTGYQEQGDDGARGRQRLIIGPWTHGGKGGTVQGELDYPDGSEDAPYPVRDAELAFQADLLGLETSDDRIADVPVVQYYVMGDVDDPGSPGNTWRTVASWPPEAAPVRLHLHADGSLDEACPSDDAPTTYLYDPADPVDTICGANLLIDAGPCDQRDAEARDDVVVFDTPVLAEAVEVTGRVTAHVFVDIDQPDTDLMVKLTDVYPDGRSMLVAEGAARLAARGTSTGLDPLQSGEVVEVEVDLWSTSIAFAPGHRLRLTVTSSNAPRYLVNHNNGLDYPDNGTGAPNPVTVRLHHGATGASYVELPMPDREAASVSVCD